MPDRYRVQRTQFSVSQAKTPAPARSLAPGRPPLQLQHPPHPTHFHHSPRSRFEHQINTECVALGFRFRRQIPPPLHDFLPLASRHSNCHIHLTLHICTTPPARDLNARSIPRAPHSDFGFAGQNPPPCSISSSWPPATPTAASTSPYTFPPLPPLTI